MTEGQNYSGDEIRLFLICGSAWNGVRTGDFIHNKIAVMMTVMNTVWHNSNSNNSMKFTDNRKNNGEKEMITTEIITTIIALKW